MLIMGIATIIWYFLSPGTIGFVVLLASCALMGSAMNLGSIPLVTYMQANLAKNIQGRVMSLISSLTSGAMLGLVFAGPIAEWLGVAAWFGIAGAIIVVISVSSLLIRPRSSSSQTIR
jgi:DHA3 family macrolide efflux protein-like MFS transporter